MKLSKKGWHSFVKKKINHHSQSKYLEALTPKFFNGKKSAYKKLKINLDTTYLLPIY